ncbi:sulfatase [Gilvimarinus chinensis]|uniref:sulfatase n=1 Tax=Gilvimarinus chinensis TaxID=396005 RepID=UPI000377E3E9|nr:sulfatase [Gilvimarinus chinensis]
MTDNIRVKSLKFITFLLIATAPLIYGVWHSTERQWLSEAPHNVAPKNIIFILIDDLNDDVGFLGSERAHTPNIDQLATRSVVFKHAFAQAPLCNPSRTSLLTGTLPSSTGIYGLKPNYWEVPALANLHTLPGYFREAGYYTATIGKVFHQNVHEASYDYIQKGWYGAFGPFPSEPLQADFSFNKYYDWGAFLEEEETADFKAATAALTFLNNKKNQQKPFFLTLGFFRPHNPRFAPKEFFDLHPLEHIRAPTVENNIYHEVPKYGLELTSYKRRQRFNEYTAQEDRARKNIQAYRASISLVDRQIGRLLQHLYSSGLIKNTVIVLASDHGVQNGEKNLWFKRTLWQGSTRVPLLIAAPDINPIQITDAVGLIDIFPTLIDYAGLPSLSQLEGKSLIPKLAGDNSNSNTVVPTIHSPGNFALQNERWRYIQYADGSEELYDHQNDPTERVNLAKPHRKTKAIETTLTYFRSNAPKKFEDFTPNTSGLSSQKFPGK